MMHCRSFQTGIMYSKGDDWSDSFFFFAGLMVIIGLLDIIGKYIYAHTKSNCEYGDADLFEHISGIPKPSDDYLPTKHFNEMEEQSEMESRPKRFCACSLLHCYDVLIQIKPSKPLLDSQQQSSLSSTSLHTRSFHTT